MPPASLPFAKWRIISPESRKNMRSRTGSGAGGVVVPGLVGVWVAGGVVLVGVFGTAFFFLGHLTRTRLPCFFMKHFFFAFFAEWAGRGGSARAVVVTASASTSAMEVTR